MSTASSNAKAPDAAPGSLSARPLQLLAIILAAAALIYTHRIASDALNVSEACSAWIASRSSIGAIVKVPLAYGAAGTILYYIGLHCFVAMFGLGEAALRGFSVIFALIALVLIFAIGREMFDDKTALAAAAIWAINPLAVVFAHLARMYSMFVAIALAHFYTLWRLRRQPSATMATMCGILGAAMLYTHPAGALVLGAEAAMLTRDTVRGRGNPAAWLAIAVAVLLYLPYMPAALSLGRALTGSHWLDWIGSGPGFSPAVEAVVLAVAAAAALWLVLGREFEPAGGGEPLRWLIAWAALPAGMMLAASIALRPMFNGRYAAPGIAATAILFAALLTRCGAKSRNLAVAGFVLSCLILVKFDFPAAQPWRTLARMISVSGRASDPVIFEAGFPSAVSAAGVANNGFPFGYLSFPFNYYFHGNNPRIVVPGYDPPAAKVTIESRVSAAGGGWLVSWKSAAAIKSELPNPVQFKITRIFRREDLAIYRITPIAPAAQRPVPGSAPELQTEYGARSNPN
ncbi:MAG: glycosyltransferase family 39 protein [Candidatus Binataceae bacterium]